jgi:hypothetical protein
VIMVRALHVQHHVPILPGSFAASPASASRLNA